jgi:hypothetical protein
MAFFEFNDERTKVDPLQKTMGIVAFEENILNGRSSAEVNVWHPDTLVRKENIFDAIKSGMIDGKPYNFNGDVYSLIGRAQDTLPQCVPVPEPTYPLPTGVSTTSTTGSPSTVPASTTDDVGTTGTPQTTTSTTGVDPINNFESGASVIIANVMMIAAFLCLLL